MTGSLRPGDRIDIWVVEKPLGAGGMGSVYRCHNADAQRIKAAVKVLESGLAANRDAQARFVREAEILHRLDHPNIVRVRNVRMDAQPPFLEMEFVEGRSLEDMLGEGSVPLEQAFLLMEQIAAALAHMHARNVRHRDIKPANLVVTPSGWVKLVDFGLAMETDLARITQHGMGFGTVSYAPPEWLDPENIDPAQWDLYAIGVVFYEMLTGEQAFPPSGHGPARKQAIQIMMDKQKRPPLDPGPLFPDDVRALIESMTAREPRARPVDADAVVARLAAIREALTAEGWELPAPYEVLPGSTGEFAIASLGFQPPPPRGRTRWLVAAALAFGVLVTVGVGIAAIAVIQQRPEPAPLPEPPPPVEPPPANRSARVDVLDLPDGYPMQLAIGDQILAPAADGGFTATELPVDELVLRWVAGQACTLDDCPGEACPVTCGHGAEAVEIEEGDGVQVLTLAGTWHAPDVTVTIPSLGEARKGVFKKLAPTLRVYLGEHQGTVTDHRARFEDVIPGTYQLITVLGECPHSAIGCWPERECPSGCTSGSRTQEVPFRSNPLLLRVGMPLP